MDRFGSEPRPLCSRAPSDLIWLRLVSEVARRVRRSSAPVRVWTTCRWGRHFSSSAAMTCHRSPKVAHKQPFVSHCYEAGLQASRLQQVVHFQTSHSCPATAISATQQHQTSSSLITAQCSRNTCGVIRSLSNTCNTYLHFTLLVELKNSLRVDDGNWQMLL